MHTLLFLRHAKSDWAAPHEHDHERPINARGQEAARRVGMFLAEQGLVPNLILASTAERVRQTLEEAQEAGRWRAEVRATRGLYLVDPEAVLEAVRRAPEEARTLLVAGHEPTTSETVARLSGGGRVRFPTATLARVDLAVEHWEQVAFGRGELRWLIPPKLMPPA